MQMFGISLRKLGFPLLGKAVLIGILIAIPCAVLQVALHDFNMIKWPQDELKVLLMSSFVVASALQWTTYIFFTNVYLKNPGIVTSMDGLIVGTAIGLGSGIGYLISTALVWPADITPAVMMLFVPFQTTAGFFMGFYLGNSKAKYNNDDIHSWQIRIVGLLMAIGLLTSVRFTATLGENLIYPKLLAGLFVLCAILIAVHIYMASAQHERYLRRRKGSRNTFIPTPNSMQLQ